MLRIVRKNDFNLQTNLVPAEHDRRRRQGANAGEALVRQVKHLTDTKPLEREETLLTKLDGLLSEHISSARRTKKKP